MKNWISSLTNHSGMNVIETNLQIPVIYRCIEGLTTTMLIGFLCGGGTLFSPLGFVYALHWWASYNHHRNPSDESFLLDVHYIDMVAMERLSYVFDPYVIQPSFVLFLFTGFYQRHRLFPLVKIFIIVVLLYLTQELETSYIISFLCCGVLYTLSDIFLVTNFLKLKVLCHVLFHLCLAHNSYLEVPMYKDIHSEHFSILRVLSYSLYILHGLGIYT